MVVEGRTKARFEFECQEVTPSLSNSVNNGDLEQIMGRLNLENETNAMTRMQTCQCKSSQTDDHIRAFTEREILTVVTLAHILEVDPTMRDLATRFLAHTVLITSLPLSNRRQPIQSRTSDEEYSLQSFLAKFSYASTTLIASGAWSEAMEAGTVSCDICDLIDGRLFEASVIDDIRGILPAQSTQAFEGLARCLCNLSGIHLELPSGSQNAVCHAKEITTSAPDAIAILPFSNPVFDRHLASINIRVTPLKSSERTSGRIFQEVSHWHNSRRRLGMKQAQQTPATAKDKARGLKRDQRFMAEMQSYAASLTNAAGKALEPEPIFVSDAKANKVPVTKENDDAGPSNKKTTENKAQNHRRGAGKKALREDIAAHKAIKESENEEKLFGAWRTVRTNLESERSLQSKYHKISAYLRDLPDSKRKILEAEVQFHLSVILLDIYRTLRKSTDAFSSKEELFGVISLLWNTARQVAKLDSLTMTIAENLRKIVKSLELPDPGIPIVTKNRKLACDPGLLILKDNKFAIDLDNQSFQLLHCGPYMDRNLDSAPDSRVPFQPDRWQRRVLDDLDAQKSVFVVAPTSAGKTFISFYAMEKILRESDDSVLGKF